MKFIIKLQYIHLVEFAFFKIVLHGYLCKLIIDLLKKLQYTIYLQKHCNFPVVY